MKCARIYSLREEKTEAFLEALLSFPLKGATFLQGVEGFLEGVASSEDVEVLSYELPLLVILCDEEERLREFFERYRSLFEEELIILTETL